ncbi:MAG: type II toxin-antitoxin system VapB family antitoxin [Bacteroidota bacterium]
MKVTALISDEIIEEVIKLTGGKNITESITTALKEYISSKKLNYLIDEVQNEPFQFNEDFTAYGIRKVNRNR